MHYLYHGVPKDMEGDTLYPLNDMKEILPEIYRASFAKYENREHLTRQVIPILDCLWNDVLHFSAIHPSKLKSAFSALGREYDFKAYQVDPNTFSGENTVIYLYDRNKKKGGFNPEYFVKYDPELIQNYTEIPDGTLEYYKERIEAGESPLLYHLVPHILHKGAVSVENLPIVS